MAAAWLLLFGLLATSPGSYAWLTLSAAIVAWLAALALVRLGDRGGAAGAAMATGLGLSIAAGVVLARWAISGWPLW